MAIHARMLGLQVQSNLCATATLWTWKTWSLCRGLSNKANFRLAVMASDWPLWLQTGRCWQVTIIHRWSLRQVWLYCWHIETKNWDWQFFLSNQNVNQSINTSNINKISGLDLDWYLHYYETFNEIFDSSYLSHSLVTICECCSRACS